MTERDTFELGAFHFVWNRRQAFACAKIAVNPNGTHPFEFAYLQILGYFSDHANC